MSGQGILERGAAPVARAASPLWKWAFLATLLTLGAGALAALALSQLQGPADPQGGEGHQSRLRFHVGDYEVPTFGPPPQPEPLPPPVPEPLVVQVPQAPFVPELPRPEPLPVPEPEPAVAEPGQSPEQIARQRRLAAPLGGAGGGSGSGSGGASTNAARTGGGEGAGLDLSATRAGTARARRLADLTFTVPKGTYIHCILDTAIQSDQAGLLACTLPRDVYGADGTVVLLDRGSQVLGEYRGATLSYGKRRIFVLWDRVRTPGGVIIDIASPGTGPLGRAGMGGHIDNHYGERVGIPVLMSALSFGMQSYAREQLSSEQARYLEGTTNDTLSGVLGELARIEPTLHKSQGEPIGILVARDLDLSAVYRLQRRGHGR
jgi:type IV secretion system protein VirB10